jgi:4-hydroxymandelate synthase
MISEAVRLARLDHVVFYVADLAARVKEMEAKHGFAVVAASDPAQADHRTVALRQGNVVLALTEGLSSEHPATAYVDSHGDGVADIALSTPDARAAFESAVASGARPLAAPRLADGISTATIHAFGDVRHTFVQRPAGNERADNERADNERGALPAGLPPGLTCAAKSAPVVSAGLRELDHVAVCVQAGQLDPTVEFYQSVFGFQEIFREQIIVGAQAMNSRAIRNVAMDLTFTIIEPDTSRAPGQIDAFIENHGGAGVQHLAFSTDDIVKTVRILRNNGVEFLSTPTSYYEMLAGRMDLTAHTVTELSDLGILADADQVGQLYQIFTRATHPRNTYFLEIIERLGAETFGSGNIKALYVAVEQERQRRECSRAAVKPSASSNLSWRPR